MSSVDFAGRDSSRIASSKQPPPPPSADTKEEEHEESPHRPSFNSLKTQDRLRESANSLPTRCSMSGSPVTGRRERKSMFREVGLDDSLGPQAGSATLQSTVLGVAKEPTRDFAHQPSSPSRQAANGGRGLPAIVVSQQDAHADRVVGGLPATIRECGNEGQQQLRQRPRDSQAQPNQSSSKTGSSTKPRKNTTSTVGSGHTLAGVSGGDANDDTTSTSPIATANAPMPTPPTSPTATANKQSWFSRLPMGRRPRIKAAASAPPPPTASSLTRVTMIAILIAVVLPAFSYNNGRTQVESCGADAGVINSPRRQQWGRGQHQDQGPGIVPRANSPTQVCTRWAHQAALLNGTIYLFGGQAKTTAGQETDTWNNNFLTLDLTKSWDVTRPILNGLPQPSGSPKVSLGYLWNDYNNLWLYGGQFADNPFVEPSRSSVWKYAVRTGTWTEDQSPETLAGKNSEPAGVAVQRSAEGAGLSVPELGLSWYFGGHLDLSTTPGWSNQIARVYLKSLLEFTHPGYANPGIDTLHSSGAGDMGAYRNITQGRIQRQDAFYERADGALVFIPGWAEMGVLIGLGGGTNTTFSDNLGTLDVYDIARSEWYHQETSGIPPSVRVNLCATVVSAPDASSFQVHVWGGQNLEPFREQVQYDDMYILTIPSFTWIKVDKKGKNQPSPRAGHTCNMRDGQMVVVGGFVGFDIDCDSPGIYVFDASRLEWTDSFSQRAPRPDIHPENSVMAASYGYTVPEEVVSVIGGGPSGSATVTAPASRPTDGPFATGKSPVFTVTAGGSTVTQTAWGPGATGDRQPGGGPENSGDGGTEESKPAAGLIAAAVLAGLAGLLALYLGFCAWLYRRQVGAYKTHLAVANRYSGAHGSHASLGGIAAAFFGRKGSKESKDGGPGRRGRWGSRRTKEDGGAAAAAGAGAGGAAASYGALGNDSGDEKAGMGSADPPLQRPGGWLHRPASASTASAPAAGRESFAWVGRDSMDRRNKGTAAWLGAGDEPTPGSGTTAAGTPGGAGSGSNRPSPYEYGGAAPGGTSGSASTARTPARSRTSGSDASSTEGLLEAQDLSFFSVVMAPRRALRVVNGLEDGEREHADDRHRGE